MTETFDQYDGFDEAAFYSDDNCDRFEFILKTDGDKVRLEVRKFYNKYEYKNKLFTAIRIEITFDYSDWDFKETHDPIMALRPEQMTLYRAEDEEFYEAIFPRLDFIIRPIGQEVLLKVRKYDTEHGPMIHGYKSKEFHIAMKPTGWDYLQGIEDEFDEWEERTPPIIRELMK